MPVVVFTDWSQVPVMVSIEEAARVIGISRSSAYNLMKAGDLPTKRVGGRRFITKAALMRFCLGEPR